MRLEYSIAPYVKMNLKWFKDWNIRYDTIKLLEENKDPTLWHKSWQDFLRLFFQGKRNKGKNKQMWPNQTQKLFTGKKTKQKHNLLKWGKIFAHDVTNKGIISQICKQLIQFNIKKENKPIKKQTEDLNRHFYK